jgi:uncharacterized protein (DUF1810 family)
MNEIYLDHFIEGHNAQFEDALKELQSGEKKTHWIWFVFPIAEGLAKSEIAQYYEVGNLSEARAFLEHEQLGTNFRKCIKAMLANTHKPALDILGKKDTWKFQASVTLFHHVCNEPTLKAELLRCLEYFYDGQKCKSTQKYLKNLG